MPTLLTSRLYIDHLRFRVANDRLHRKRLIEMALELKRLQGKAMTFRGNIEDLGREYDRANEITVEHVADVRGLRKQVNDMSDDLRATVDITKNSVAASNSGGDGKQDDKASTGAETPKVSPPPLPEVEKQTVSAEEVGKLPPATFQQDQPK